MSTPTNLSGTDKTISVSAVILRDPAGHWLTVRKRGTSCFMHPGGKPEPGETAAEAALREVGEEIGLGLDSEALEPLGHVRTAAANEPGFSLDADVFLAPCEVDPRPAAEIEELRWLDPRELSAEGERNPELAPLLYDCARMWPHTAS